LAIENSNPVQRIGQPETAGRPQRYCRRLPATRPEKSGAPDASAIPRHKRIATRNTTMDAVKSPNTCFADNIDSVVPFLSDSIDCPRFADVSFFYRLESTQNKRQPARCRISVSVAEFASIHAKERTMKIRSRLGLALLATGLILLGLGFSGAWYVLLLQKRNSEIISNNVFSIRAAEELELKGRTGWKKREHNPPILTPFHDRSGHGYADHQHDRRLYSKRLTTNAFEMLSVFQKNKVSS
jgi:hypothetical protein